MRCLGRWLLAAALATSTVFLPPFTTGHHEVAAAADPTVVFNVETLNYHDPGCLWAHRCTRHCIRIPLSDARRRGGIPCKVCGG